MLDLEPPVHSTFSRKGTGCFQSVGPVPTFSFVSQAFFWFRLIHILDRGNWVTSNHWDNEAHQTSDSVFYSFIENDKTTK